MESSYLASTSWQTEPKVDKMGNLEFINSLNHNSAAARFYKNNNTSTSCQAFFHGVYDKSSFGFFSAYSEATVLSLQRLYCPLYRTTLLLL